MTTIESLQSEIATIDNHIARLREAKEKLPEEPLDYETICCDVFGCQTIEGSSHLLNTIAFAYRVVPEGWNIVVERNGYCRITDGNWIYSDEVENNPAAALAMCLCDWKIAELRERREKLHAQLCKSRGAEADAREEIKWTRLELWSFVMFSMTILSAWAVVLIVLR